MGIALFNHQQRAAQAIEAAWLDGHKNVLSVLPTGAGKTLLKAEMVRRELAKGGMCAMFAHRDVLLEQISLALCLMGVKHKFITSKKTERMICDAQVREFGQCFKDNKSRVIVCSVDKYYRMDTSLLDAHITLWLMDESHHLLRDGKWYKCITNFVNAKGLGVTATPIRADKKGLGRGEPIYDAKGVFKSYDNDGVFDLLIDDREIEATMHDLISIGRLSTYKIYTPPPLFNRDAIKTTASGEFNQREAAQATDKSSITGDAVKHYRKLAHNKQTIIFTTNIAHSDHVAEQFRMAGYNAISVSSETNPLERTQIINDFKAGRVKILVNCDLFSEGFDVPAVECVIMLRATQSYSLFKQQFGRMLRVILGKEFGILIDHVGNVEAMMYRYNLEYPHDDPEWTLERASKRKTGGGEVRKLTRVCPECFNRYSPIRIGLYVCPECEHEETPEEELDAFKKFQEKEGDLIEMSIDIISKIQEERKLVDRSPEYIKNYMKNAPAVVRNSQVVKQTKRLNAQSLLREQIQNWCLNNYAYDKVTTQREFELKFKIHPRKAALLGEREANELKESIQNGML